MKEMKEMKGSPLGRMLCGLLGGLAISFAFAASSFAAYPDRPITIVLPYTAGGTSDSIVRVVANQLSLVWKQPIIVDAKPGAGGQIAMEYVAHAKPDGYTLVLDASGTMGVNPQVYAGLRYDPFKDFTPITTLVAFPLVLFVNNTVPVDNIAGFLELAKKKPGGVTVGNIGIGTQQHLSQALFMQMAKVEMTLVPYKGSAALTTDFLGGRLDAIYDTMGGQEGNLAAGKVKALAVMSKKRLPELPNVPTLDESGFPGYEAVPWFGLAGPAGTPADIVLKIQQEVARAFAIPELRKQIAALGMIPIGDTPAENAARIRTDFDTMRKVAKDIDLKPQ